MSKSADIAVFYTLRTCPNSANGTDNQKNHQNWNSPGGPVVESLPANAGDTGLILAPGTRSHMCVC